MKEGLTLQSIRGRRAMCPAPAFREKARHLIRRIKSMLPQIKPVLPQLKKEAAGKSSLMEPGADLSERHPGRADPEAAFLKMSPRRERRTGIPGLTGTAKRRKMMKNRPVRKKK